MFDNQNYVHKKEVDWSVLQQGISIPVKIQVVFQKNINRFLRRGESKDIFLVLENNTYKAKLVNQKFDESKYPGHKDILQIRYKPNSEIAETLRTIFSVSYNYILEQRKSLQENHKKNIRLPENIREHLAIYTTEFDDTYYLECITAYDSKIIRQTLVKEDEQEFEAAINYNKFDPNANIETVNQLVKVRKLNRAIGENLKLLYDNCCQICGNNFGKVYDVSVVETHHIDPFVSSLNNDAENQIIVCPNHHRTIHKAKPAFEKKKHIFIYSNGLVEKLVLNKHIG